MQFKDITNFFGVTENYQTDPAKDTETPKVLQEPPVEKKVLHEWTAQSRPDKKALDQKKMRTLIIIGVVISLLLVAMKEFFLILVILSLIFVSYMLSQTKPEDLKYEISNKGFKYADRFYYWESVKHFFYIKSGDLDVMVIDLIKEMPARLFITLIPGDRDKVHKIMEHYANYVEEEPKTFLDRAYDSVTDKIDLQGDSGVNKQKEPIHMSKHTHKPHTENTGPELAKPLPSEE